jgi:chromosomal replication initiation ATPase DnaA
MHVHGIAADYNLTRYDILGPSKFKPIVNARRACVNHFLALDMRPEKIGGIINRHRTSVLYLAGMIDKSKVAKNP